MLFQGQIFISAFHKLVLSASWNHAQQQLLHSTQLLVKGKKCISEAKSDSISYYFKIKSYDFEIKNSRSDSNFDPTNLNLITHSKLEM